MINSLKDLKFFKERREIFSGSEGGAGIPFLFNPFPSRPARAVWDFAKRRRRFAQNGFAHFQL
jgi:hypothetical protein